MWIVIYFWTLHATFYGTCIFSLMIGWSVIKVKTTKGKNYIYALIFNRNMLMKAIFKCVCYNVFVVA